MSANTKIEWCDHTFNPWIGCTKVGPGCDHCYAEAEFDHRRHRATWGAGQPRSRTKTWGDPVCWNKQADAFFAEHGRRQRVFCASLADWLDKDVPIEWLVDLLALILATPNLDWLLLTKRIGNWKTRMQAVLDYYQSRIPPTPTPRSVTDEEADAMNWVDAWIRNDVDPIPANVWIGATICNQPEADRDLPKLERVPAAVHFVSIEPMLGEIDLKLMQYHDSDNTDEQGRIIANTRRRWLRWAICGGESGPNARPMHPDWARGLRDQCEAAGVPFMFKQWGSYAPHIWFDGPDAESDECPDPFLDLERVKHQFIAVDGREWDTNGGQWMYPPLPLGHWCLMTNVGKKASGRVLDGREWNGVPA